MKNNPALTLAVAKLAAAVAWADGILEPEEKHAVRDIVFSLPTLSERAWQEVEMYLDKPVSDQELNRLIADTTTLMSSTEDREKIVAALRLIASCDGHVAPEELATINQVIEAVNDQPLSMGEQFKDIVMKAISRRRESAARGSMREDRIDDYLMNTVYYDVVSASAEANRTIRLPEEKLRETCLASGIMAALIISDMQKENAFDVVTSALKTVWRLGENDAKFIARLSLDRAKRGIDTLRICRSFFEITTSGQREAFLRCLAAAASAEGSCSPSVSVHLAEIAAYLRVPDEAYRETIGSLSIAKNRRPETEIDN
ncbi:MAG: TerB family tellurite resistance protein [Bdellovibrionales bacterium]|nr:TerB family tellurite resistance protein [Bdellovibrionales bacterium]